VEIYTIGYKKKSAEEFFEALKRAGIQRVVDVRLKNTSHLAGFAKKDHLRYFLREICDADYVHETILAPTEDILSDHGQELITWEEYENRFLSLLKDREVEKVLDKRLFEVPVALLCSELKPDKCHRRLVAEYLKRQWQGDVIITHL